jgi:hypothetical protein
LFGIKSKRDAHHAGARPAIEVPGRAAEVDQPGQAGYSFSMRLCGGWLIQIKTKCAEQEYAATFHVRHDVSSWEDLMGRGRIAACRATWAPPTSAMPPPAGHRSPVSSSSSADGAPIPVICQETFTLGLSVVILN